MSMFDVRSNETRAYDIPMVLAETTGTIASRFRAAHAPIPTWLMLTVGQVCAVFWLRGFQRHQRDLEDFLHRQKEIPITRYEREAAYRSCDYLRELCKTLLSSEHEYRKMQYHRILLLRGTFLKFHHRFTEEKHAGTLDANPENPEDGKGIADKV